MQPETRKQENMCCSHGDSLSLPVPVNTFRVYYVVMGLFGTVDWTKQLQPRSWICCTQLYKFPSSAVVSINCTVSNMVVAPPPRRPLRGSRLSSFYPPIPAEGPSLSDLDSAFQLQEYISLLIRKNPHDVETIVSLPGKVKGKGENDESSSEKDGKGEVFVDEACWIYEHLRCVCFRRQFTRL